MCVQNIPVWEMKCFSQDWKVNYTKAIDMKRESFSTRF